METAVKYYTSITDLPLSKFIECLVDNNLSALTISGFPDKDELEKAWQNLLLDYNENMGDSEHRMYYALCKEMGMIKGKMTLVKLAILRLSIAYNKEMHDDLNLYTQNNYKFDQTNPEEYKKDLEKAERRSKAFIIEHDLKQAQIDAFEAKNKIKGKAVKPTKEYFLSILITLTDFSKVSLTTEITVFEFCTRVKRYGQHIKMMEDNDKKRK